MREDGSFRPVQSTRETSLSRLSESFRTRNLLGASVAVALLLVFVTGDLSVVYPVFGGVCLVWGAKTAVTASLASNKQIENPSDPDE